MSTATFKLKDIFTIINITAFYKEYSTWLIKNFSSSHIWHIGYSIKHFLECRDYKKNFASFVCPECGEKAIRPHTCKSKLCPTCGKIYSNDIANNFSYKMIDKPHRHILFTLPDYLWLFFLGNTHVLAIISDKLFIHFKKYYKNNSIESFAFSVFFHTFGRDMKFNPHIHIIITEGGFKKDLCWKSLTYFHWGFFSKPWKTILSDSLKMNLKPSVALTNALNLLWKEDSKVFFNVKGEPLRDSEYTIKYLGRYLARPPIAEYRIKFYDGKIVTFWYKDKKTKKKITTTLPVLKFIGRILIHIPPKNFKMVRHYGIYARNINKDLKVKLTFLGFKRKLQTIKKSWQQNIFEWIGFNPLICPHCNIEMEIHSIIYNKKVYTFKT